MATIAMGDVHGDLRALSDLCDQFRPEVASGDTVVMRHHNSADIDANGWPHPRVLRATVGIDTISHGVLTAMRFSGPPRISER